MTIEEIKTIFGIDITEKKRTPLLVALRCLNIDFEIQKQIKETNSFNITKIARSLSLDRSTIYHAIKTTEKLKNDTHYSKLILAVKNKDKKLFEVYLKEVEEEKQTRYVKNYKRKTEIKKVIRLNNSPKEEKKPDQRIRKLTNSHISNFLRQNNDLESNFWNIPAKKLTENNFLRLRKMNPVLFDKMLENV